MYGRIKNRRVDFSFRTAVIVCICFVGALLMAPAGQVSAQDSDKMNIVYIETGKILEAHPAFVKAKKDFETELEGMQQKLKTMGEEEQMMAQQQMQQQIQLRGEKLQEEALKEMKADLQKIADEKGYDYVFDANSLIAGGKNVTEEVMKAMNIEEGEKQE